MAPRGRQPVPLQHVFVGRRGSMRAVFFINLIAIVTLAGALGRMYEGAPLPWTTHDVVVMPPAETSALATPQVQAEVPASPAPDARGSLRILTEGDYPPFNYRGPDGRLTGFDIELARALCERMKRDCRFETHGWASLVSLLQRGQGDAVVASMLIPSPAREALSRGEGIIFTQRYYSTPGHFAARKSGVSVAASAASLAGKRIAVQSGSIHEAFLKQHFPGVVIIGAASLDEAEKALTEARVDMLFADRNALLRWLKDGHEASCCQMVGVDYSNPEFFGAGVGIALRASDKGLRDEFDIALRALLDDGTYAAISRRYFGQNIR